MEILQFIGDFIWFSFLTIGYGLCVGLWGMFGMALYTFTQETTFGLWPQGISVVALGAIAYHHFRPVPSLKWVRFAKCAAVCLTWLPPAILLASLFALAWRGMLVLGHWPEPFMDDPKHICGGDAIYQMLYRWLDVATTAAGCLTTIWFALVLHLAIRQLIPLRQFFQLHLTCALAWVLVVVEPGQRIAWWMD